MERPTNRCSQPQVARMTDSRSAKAFSFSSRTDNEPLSIIAMRVATYAATRPRDEELPGTESRPRPIERPWHRHKRMDPEETQLLPPPRHLLQLRAHGAEECG